MDTDGDVKLKANRVGDLYYVYEKSTEHCKAVTNEFSTPPKMPGTLMSWHRRLGHLNIKDLLDVERNETVLGIKIEPHTGEIQCDTCIHGKMTRAPFPRKSNRKTEILEIVHFDVCGPMRTASNGKAKYFVIFIDDYTK